MTGQRIPDHVLQEIKQRVDLEQVVGRVVRLKRQGRRSVGLCPFHQERTPSFGVHPSGRYFKCFGCGAAGDAIGFTMRMHDLDFQAAARLLAQDLGIVLDGPKAQVDPAVARRRSEEWARAEDRRREEERQEREEQVAWCRRAWQSCRDQPPDFAILYLRGRGLRLQALPASIRCHPRMPHKESGRDLPCMVAAVQNLEGQILGLHRTFLHRSPDGSVHKTALKPAKKMNGTCWGGAVRLSRPASTLVIGEGLETVLSVMQALDGEVDDHAFWAALSLGNLAGRGQGMGAPHPTRKMKNGKPARLPSTRPDPDHPGILLPPWARRVVILADADNADPPAAEALLQCAANRFRGEGRDVRIARPPEGMDFNDVLKSGPADSGGPLKGSAGGSTPAAPPEGQDFSDVLRGAA